MTVVMYGKPSEACGMCKSAKEKMAILGVDYTFILAQPLMELHDGWRTDEAVELLAFYSLLPMDEKLPIFRIDGTWLSYAMAMKTLKAALKEKKQ